MGHNHDRTYASIKQYLYGSESIPMGSLPNTQMAIGGVTVIGAVVGDFVKVTTSVNMLNLLVFASVTGPDAVTVYVVNFTGSSVSVPTATYYVEVTKRIAT